MRSVSMAVCGNCIPVALAVMLLVGVCEADANPTLDQQNSPKVATGAVSIDIASKVG